MSQRVIVTGGSGGIGAAIVGRFAADGARVAVLDRRAPDGDSAFGFFAVDLLDPVDTRRAIGEAIAASTARVSSVISASIPWTEASARTSRANSRE